jgi:large subunit ribosomal protein L3
MTDENGMRRGSLQFYPRVRAKKVIPSVNWGPLSKDGVGFLGFVGYKVGMVSVSVKDDTEHSLTKNKRIVVPATVVECPSMKIYSVRFYKNSKVLKDVVVTNDKDLKKKVKISKEAKKIDDEIKDLEFDDVRVLLYTNVKATSVDKKKPDMLEVGLSGSSEEKLEFIKERIGKDVLVSEVFGEGLVDVRAVTKGFGTQGPVKRFGISLKSHKSEKGRRRPGSLAPWHPARVTFRAPQAGQTGYHNRITYNNVVLKIGNVGESDINKSGGFEHYGVVRNEYMILKGSIPGPKKRGIVITQPIKPSKYLAKKKLEVLEIR